jgi:hypothetical protein
MPTRQYDWRALMSTPTDREILLRQVQRLRTAGRTPDDIGTLLGLAPADVRLLIFGLDDPGGV